MPNGRPGDSPYLDMVAHKLDLDEPEIAARLREVDKKADLDVKYLLADLVDRLFRELELEEDDTREELLQHLDTIERLCKGQELKK